jgi:hypothetical protein
MGRSFPTLHPRDGPSHHPGQRVPLSERFAVNLGDVHKPRKGSTGGDATASHSDPRTLASPRRPGASDSSPAQHVDWPENRFVLPALRLFEVTCYRHRCGASSRARAGVGLRSHRLTGGLRRWPEFLSRSAVPASPRRDSRGGKPPQLGPGPARRHLAIGPRGCALIDCSTDMVEVSARSWPA